MPPLTAEQAAHFIHQLQQRFGGNISAVTDPSEHSTWGNGTIVDTGTIDDLIDPTNRSFSTSEVNRALMAEGILEPTQWCRKIGASGAIFPDHRGGEVIEDQTFMGRAVMSSARVASINRTGRDSGRITVEDLGTNERAILENAVVFRQTGSRENPGLHIRGIVENPGDVITAVAGAAREIGVSHYSLRCEVMGELSAGVSVLRHAPSKVLTSIDDLAKILERQTWGGHGHFSFGGSRTDATATRQSDRWGKIAGSSLYAPDGHYHGEGTVRIQGEVDDLYKLPIGGHIVSLSAQPNSRLELIFEPAKVVQIHH
ncbi:hypothetical protein KBD59_05640 [Candidatus Gracilibacteria bacterium]|nr:hypothetical protein [Candidatus Gracilibacteria bacterium]